MSKNENIVPIFSVVDKHPLDMHKGKINKAGNRFSAFEVVYNGSQHSR